MALPSGTRLGRYEIRTHLGEGGMGEVYLAWDCELEREVAVKVLRADRDETPDRVRRFAQEAKAASGLNHPNVATVYDFGSSDDLRFIAMELVQGETLRARLARGSMALDEVLDIGTQVAAALAAAHAAGIVHRDVKPENVMVRPDGYAKVLDFGLAKLSRIRDQDAETLMRTESGVVMGTIRYMAPEQFAGSLASPAADVFSLGVVLYEMVSGRRPFDGSTATEIVSAVLTKTPAPLGTLRSDTPPRLAAVIARALQKEAENRYPTAAELLDELRQISRAGVGPVVAPGPAAGRSRRPRAALAAVALLLSGVAGGLVTWKVREAKRVEKAGAAIARAEALLARQSHAEAFDAALAAAAITPDDPRVQALLLTTSTRVTILSEPAGASVYLERFKGNPKRVAAGLTPLTIGQIARADYVVTLEKDGFAPAVRPLSLAPLLIRGWNASAEPSTLTVKLAPRRNVPPEMVMVDGGSYRLSGWSRPSDRAVELRDFLIDRHEVSNREFEQFVREGGYRRRELWKHPFVLDGRTLPFEEAMDRFRDGTGLPGPRGWSGGAPPAGRAGHPVTGVSWYEAAAFAEWKGKSLPTIFQWEKAARAPMRGAVGSAMPWGGVAEGVDVTERTNFRGHGTMPVDSLPFGVGPWGAYHMAGNVSEWCLNAMGPGFVVRGGSWIDPVYTFGRTGALPAFFASETVGFRCVKDLLPGVDQGSFALNPVVPVPEYRPVSDAEFEQIRRRYDYQRGPLDARVVERIETPDWRRERIVYSVAGRDVPAYLYLPKGFKGPLQVIHFAPAGDVVSGERALPASIEASLAPLIRGGRAVFSVVGEGFTERPRRRGFEEPDSRSDEYVDYIVSLVTELRRGLDYLETRREIDSTRVAFIGPSAGSWAGLILTAVEPRYRSVLFIGTRIHPREITDARAANRINFAPHIAAPKMMLQGRYDESAPLESQTMPLFRILREPKRLQLYDGSHVPPMDIAVPAMTGWLDETMGKVSG